MNYSWRPLTNGSSFPDMAAVCSRVNGDGRGMVVVDKGDECLTYSKSTDVERLKQRYPGAKIYKLEADRTSILS